MPSPPNLTSHKPFFSDKENNVFKEKEDDLGFETAFATNFIESNNRGQEGKKGGGTSSVDILSMKKGSFFRRFFAFNIDLSLQFFIFLIFFLAGFYTLKQREFLSGSTLSGSDIGRMMAPLFFLTLLISAGYFIFFHWATGQTPGKMLLKLKVIDKRGNPPGFWRSSLRWAGYSLSGSLFMLGYLMVLVDRQSQALHDKIAGTYVIDVRSFRAKGGGEG